MTARHSPLFTLESGQSGLGFYTSGRDAADLATGNVLATVHGIGSGSLILSGDSYV